jgi:peptide/nickel transport system substrate-binding protein
MLRNRFVVHVLAFVLAAGVGLGARAEHHGIALYGVPALPKDYAHLPEVNPDAPKGGRFVDGQVGTFDSLNPHILAGGVPWQLRFLAYESLMGRAWNEPFTLYGLLAETVEVNEDETAITYTLRPEARFSDGSPVTVEDVIWSWDILGGEGANGRYRSAFAKIDEVEPVGARGVRFTASEPDRELLMITGMRPILKKAQWAGREDDFFRSGMDNVPIASAPYVVSDAEAGRFVELTRDPDYWGADLPFRRGTHNFDVIRMEFFGDANAHFEAFKGGLLSTMRETNAAAWARDYDFPRVRSGDVVLSEIPHQRPTGMTGLVMNTRTAPFDDWRVREAMIQAFNFEYVNGVINGGTQPRIASYFANSPLGMRPGPAEGRVAELLAAAPGERLPGTVEGYELPATDGGLGNRRGIRRATGLLEEAGYAVEGGRLTGPDGPVRFEILVPTGSSEVQSIVDIYVLALERLGIEAVPVAVDSAQFRERQNAYDFDMIWYRWGLSLSPGNEQLAYWGPAGVETPGSRNLMGADDPVCTRISTFTGPSGPVRTPSSTV